jgi:hypothetical protein
LPERYPAVVRSFGQVPQARTLPVGGDHQAADLGTGRPGQPDPDTGHQPAVRPESPPGDRGLRQLRAELLEGLHQRRHRQVAVRLSLGHVGRALQGQHFADVVSAQPERNDRGCGHGPEPTAAGPRRA